MRPRPRNAEGGVFQNINSPERGTSPGASSPWSLLFALVGFVGLCLLVGGATGTITELSVHDWYPSLTRPPGTPPNRVFPIVWTVLYVMIGIAAWRIWRDSARAPARRAAALRLWGWQLLCNALWTPAFFGLESPLAGLIVIAVLLLLIAFTLRAFARLDRLAMTFLLPYGLWTAYAAYLNVGFWWLN